MISYSLLHCELTFHHRKPC